MRKGKDENVDPRGQAFFLCGFEGAKLSVKTTPAQHNISGDNSLRVPPVPIPNTEVKPQHADGTWLETARESRSSPVSNSMIVVIKFLLSYALVAQWQSIRLLTEGL